MARRKASLRDQIRKAKDEKAVNALLAKGKKYKFASSKTRQRWSRAASARRGDIAHGE